MDIDKAKYILRFFKNLLTEEEASICYQVMQKPTLSESTLKDIILSSGWLITADELDKMFDKKEYNIANEKFEIYIATRVLERCEEKIYFNTCPKCTQPTRTPQSRQCRFCGHNWHHIVAGTFRFNSAHEITGRHFYLFGNVYKGEIKEGQFMDLTNLGLNCKPKIDAVGQGHNKIEGKLTPFVALGTNELNSDQRNYLSKFQNSTELFDVLKE